MMMMMKRPANLFTPMFILDVSHSIAYRAHRKSLISSTVSNSIFCVFFFFYLHFRDDTTLTAIAVCDSSINICLDKNDPTEFGTEEFKQSDILSDTSTELDKGTNNEGDDTALTAIAVCDPSINICLDKNDPPDLGTEEFKQRFVTVRVLYGHHFDWIDRWLHSVMSSSLLLTSVNTGKDSNLTTVVVHSNEDISTAEDSGLRAVIVHSNEDISSCDILSDTTTKRDELNNNEGNHMKKIANKILLFLSFSLHGRSTVSGPPCMFPATVTN
ncbi:uncharacterized protein RHO17_004769 [Thomomys bottae]